MSWLALLGLISWGLAWADGSIYDAEVSLWNESGQKVLLSQWKGKPVIATMAYTSCSHTCPLILNKLKDVQRKLGTKSSGYEFILISLDPERDTPESLRKFRAKNAITNPNWHLVSAGTDAETRKVSMLLGIKYRKDPVSREIMHDNKILLISREGEIVQTVNGLGAPIDALLSDS